MAKTNRRFPALGAWLACISGGALAASAVFAARDVLADAETRRAVVAVKQGILAGHRARDRAALDRLYADDYAAIDSKGAIRTKKELLDGLSSGPEIVEGAYDIVAVRRWGELAVANGHGHIVYRNPDGSTRVSDYDSFNVFELREGRWYYVGAFLP